MACHLRMVSVGVNVVVKMCTCGMVTTGPGQPSTYIWQVSYTDPWLRNVQPTCTSVPKRL